MTRAATGDVTVHEGPLPPPTAEQVRALAERAQRVDGIEALGEQTLLNLGDPGADVVHLLAGALGTGSDLAGYAQLDLAGYAQLDLAGARASGAAGESRAPGEPGGPATGGAGERTASGELVVDPTARRRGIGTALLAAVRASAQAAGVDRPAVWAHGDLAGAQGLAADAGMRVVRELWQMSLDLDEYRHRVPGVPGDGWHAQPGGGGTDVVVRGFEVGRDEQGWLEVNARAFADHPEQGRMTLADLQAREREPWFNPADLLLAEREGRLLASAWIKVEPGGTSGELYALGVDPDAQGSGLGRLLTAVVLDHLAAKALHTAVLYTEANNIAAVRTYSAAGFIRSRTDTQYR